MKLSIAIPTYDMQRKDLFLIRLLDSLWIQKFQDFEVVVTDNSDDDVIQKICEYYKTGIKYFKNPNKGMAQNTNEAIKKSKGELIKIIYMDDYLAHERALSIIVNKFKGDWLVTACTHIAWGKNYTEHVHYPRYSYNIYAGNNTIGSPSVLTIKNEHPLLFDENLGWLLDCDYYHRMYIERGEPTIVRDVNVILGLHNGQVTNLLEDSHKLAEVEYMTQKFI